MGTRRKAMVVPRTGFHQRRAGSMELRRFAARPLPLRELPQPLPLEITPLSFLASTSARRTTSRHFVGRESSLVPPQSPNPWTVLLLHSGDDMIQASPLLPHPRPKSGRIQEPVPLLAIVAEHCARASLVEN